MPIAPPQLLLQLRTKWLSQQLRLDVKSPAIHAFFKNLSNGKTTNLGDTDSFLSGEFFTPPALPRVDYLDFSKLEWPELYDSDTGQVNAAFLRHTKLDEGFSFKLPTLIHETDLTNIENRLVIGLGSLYRYYMRDHERDMNIGIRPTAAHDHTYAARDARLDWYVPTMSPLNIRQEGPSIRDGSSTSEPDF